MFRKNCRQDPEHGVHKFRPRTTEEDNGIRLKTFKSEGGHSLEDWRRLSIIEKYLYDVCGKRTNESN